MADRHKNRTAEDNAARKAAHIAKHSDIAADLDAALGKIDWKRRHRAERDFLTFLRTYCTGEGGFLETPPPKAMQPIVRDMAEAIGDNSTPYHIRIARGHGKTSYTKGAIKWMLATGRRRFIVAVGSNSGNAQNILDDVFDGMVGNPAFVQDYPEIAVPFLKLGGAYQRAKTQTYHGENTNPQKSSSRLVLPIVRGADADGNPGKGDPLPTSGAILLAVGFASGARGKVKMTQRPDFVIFDDLQTDDRSASEEQVHKSAARVKKAFMGLAGHRKKIAAIMTSTPIAPDDLSETFAADPGWNTKTYKMLLSWPKCHDPAASVEERKSRRDFWQEYADIFQGEQASGRPPHVAANRFYRAHRRAMDEGAEVLNPGNYDRKTELSGVQHAMNLLFRDGVDAFMSEYQMQPPRQVFALDVTARLIMSRVRKDAPAVTVPPWAVLTVAATDINPSYALSTAVISFDLALTAQVVAYHVTPIKIPEKTPDPEFDRLVYAALVAHGREIAAQGVKIDRWGVDAGGRMFRAVTRFAPSSVDSCALEATAMLGKGGQNWNPNVRSRIRNPLNDTVYCRDSQGREWLAWNADAYKERMHLAWTAEIGAPSGLTLFGGGVNHARFASQIANERLVSKEKIRRPDGQDGWRYKWATKEPHDYGDCCAMCYALAGAEGLTGDGTRGASGNAFDNWTF